jgi:hypothetical protein
MDKPAAIYLSLVGLQDSGVADLAHENLDLGGGDVGILAEGQLGNGYSDLADLADFGLCLHHARHSEEHEQRQEGYGQGVVAHCGVWWFGRGSLKKKSSLLLRPGAHTSTGDDPWPSTII